MSVEMEAIKLGILNCNKEIEKLRVTVTKLKTFARFITISVSPLIGADQAKEYIKFIEEV